MRGKLLFLFSANSALGITPAGAGKTKTKKMSQGSIKDHPRRCGENENDGFTLGKIIGSPPQVRGKH